MAGREGWPQTTQSISVNAVLHGRACASASGTLRQDMETFIEEQSGLIELDIAGGQQMGITGDVGLYITRQGREAQFPVRRFRGAAGFWVRHALPHEFL